MKIQAKKIITFFIVSLLLFLVGCGQSEAAKAVDAQIIAIGEVSKESLPDIESAEHAYINLDEQDQKQVKKYDTLVNARNIYSQLRADEVISLIYDIGEVTIENLDKVVVAEEALNQLTDREVALVTNIEDYNYARVTRVEQLIELSMSNPAKYIEAITAYEELEPYLRNAVNNYSKMEKYREWIENLYNEFSLSVTAYVNAINTARSFAQSDDYQNIVSYAREAKSYGFDAKSHILSAMDLCNEREGTEDLADILDNIFQAISEVRMTVMLDSTVSGIGNASDLIMDVLEMAQSPVKDYYQQALSIFSSWLGES